jgi:hypothetical protein
MKILIISALIALSGCAAKYTLPGRWETQRSVNGNVTGVVFKEDNSFEGYVNKKPFVSGKYKMKGDVMTMVDNGCDGKTAIYKVIFFNRGDSMRFQPIQDSCEGRKEGMKRTIMGRVK